MKIACCQLDIVWEDKSANYKKVRSLLQPARLPAGSLLLLPEMFATGFSMNPANTCERAPSQTESFLADLAREFHLFVLGGLVRDGSGGRPQNQAVVFNPEGQLLCRYAKVHPFTLGGESECYAAGNEVRICRWQECQVAPFICYDLRFPEIFRSAVRQGAQLFPVIANWPAKRDAHWATLLQARAIENQAYVAGVNRCGADPKHVYSGRSLIVDPHGRVLCEIGNEEGLISAEIDLAGLEAWRKDFPALSDAHWRDEPAVQRHSR